MKNVHLIGDNGLHQKLKYFFPQKMQLHVQNFSQIREVTGGCPSFFLTEGIPDRSQIVLDLLDASYSALLEEPEDDQKPPVEKTILEKLGFAL